MKCLVLAGGNGNRLWPLSRKVYPKQFMKIRNNMSLLQEAVMRNQELCDEFLIISNINYSFIIENQMGKFENIKYKTIYETEGRNTAPAIALACLHCDPDELVFVVSSDHMIEGKEYKRAIEEAKKLAEENNIVIFGIEPTDPNTGYGYIQYEGNNVVSFKEKPSYEKAKQYLHNGNYLWNSGMFLFKAGVLLNELREYRQDIYEACKEAYQSTEEYGRSVYEPEVMRRIPNDSIDYAVLEKSNKVKVVSSYFDWCDVGNLEVLSKYLTDKEKYVINNRCENTTAINKTNNKLVVLNNLTDVIVVNTEDAVYISKKNTSDNIKNIINENKELYNKYFSENTTCYRPWGYYEILKYDEKYRVRKITIYPKSKISLHKHKYRSEHWVILNGIATITLNNDKQEYKENQSIYVPMNEKHMIENNTDNKISVIEIAMGETLSEADIIRY